MNRHPVRTSMWMPSVSVSRIGGPLTSHPAPSESSAIGFPTAIGLTTTMMIVGAALMTTVPFTVMLPLATVLSSGLIAGVLVSAGERWLAGRRSTAQP